MSGAGLPPGLAVGLAILGGHVTSPLPDGGLAWALVAALLLGLRHATDPDHLTAVATLVLAERREGPGASRRAGLLGLAWGLGHAATLVAVGLPLVLLGRDLPDAVHRGAEFAVGLLIAALAVRLLVRWRRGYLHMHPHRHGAVLHVHPHVHEHPRAEDHPHPHEHRHEHGERLARSPLGAFGVGLVHGVGGSAGAGVLVAASLAEPGPRALALTLFAAATALAMAAVSWAAGRLAAHPTATRRLEAALPAAGAASLLFGLWYALQAIA